MIDKIKNNYRFDNSIDENGKEKHLHQIFKDNEWKNLKGNTTVLKVISKPLTWWASGLACSEFGWIKELKGWDQKPTPEQVEQNKIERLTTAEKALTDIKLLDVESYLKKLDKAYKAHSVRLDKSADTGVEMHESLENYAKYCIKNNEGIPQDFPQYKLPQTKIFADWAIKNVKRFIISEGHSFHEELWVGGIGDLIYEDNEGKFVMFDFKSSKEVYMSQFLQNAGMNIMISENGVLDAEGNLIYKLERPIDYYGVFPFGAKNPEPKFYYNPDFAKEVYKSAVILDKFINLK